MKKNKLNGPSCFYRILTGLCLIFLVMIPTVQAAEPVIIDHTCTDIWQVPEAAIGQAKTSLHIAYGHTSHGSQVISGMGTNNGGYFDDFMSSNGATPGLYLWNNGGTGGALDLHDYFADGDLGNPDRTTWAQRTRDYLDDPANSEVNVVMWSWCGQAATSIENIDIYLNLMEDLIQDYPLVNFVFMTGHLDGTGPTGLLHLANEHIRNHCLTHNRILYDFADIESYDPDGAVNYMELAANDNCDYDSDNDGSRDRNWALDWQASHVEGVDWWASGAAHSQHLNGNLKGKAAWWLWATLAGWNHTICVTAPSGLTGTLAPDQSLIQLSWTDNSGDESGFILHRKVDDNDWNTAYASLPADTISFSETPLGTGSYTYRVAAVVHNDPAREPCTSSFSNTVTIQIAEQEPEAPGNLAAVYSGGQVALSWIDNSDDEAGFVVERRLEDGTFTVMADLDADTAEYIDITVNQLSTYTYRVKAYNGFGDSGYSNEASIYIPEQILEVTLKQGVSGYLGCTDTYLDESTPLVNYGETLYKSISSSPGVNMAIRFDLPEELDHATIEQAVLVLYCWSISGDPGGGSFEIYELTEPWDENTADWIHRDSSADWLFPGGTFAVPPVATAMIQSSAFYPEFDLTDTVQDWVNQTRDNNGLLLVNPSPAETGIKASEYSEYGRPYLTIQYSPSPVCDVDPDGDSDTDGQDLAILAGNGNMECLGEFASHFGL